MMKTTAQLVTISLAIAVNLPGSLRASEVDSLPPLNTLGTQSYQGAMGGLYANGQNEPSGEYAAALKRVSETIVPLDREGKPDPHGKIVVVGLGASVCLQIFAKLEELNPQIQAIRPQLVVVNCAHGGCDVNKMADPRYWKLAEAALQKAGVTAKQVQVVWYQSDDLRNQKADFPGRPQRLKESIAGNLRQAKENFPNLRLCYHSARHTTAFMSDKADKASQKHAEPRPYLVGWAVKWLIEEQMAGKRADLRFEGDGAVMPLCAWATYFWTAGDRPREDGYHWTRADVVADGVHLSSVGQDRVAQELINFWHNDPYAKIWFVAHDKNTVSKNPVPQFRKDAGPNEPAWIINGANKIPKLQRLLVTTENVRVVVCDLQGKQIAEIQDVFRKHTDLNQLIGSGEFRLEFYDKNGQRIQLTQKVAEVLRLK